MMSYQDFAQLQLNAESGYGWLVIFIGCCVITAVYLGRFLPRFTLRIPAIVPPALPVIVAIGLLVRLPVMFQNLWYDETFTARMVSLPLSQLPSAILGDVHPPLGYLIQWVAARVFGTSEFALRLPSLVFGLLCVVLVYRLAFTLYGHYAALWAALIVTLLPMPVYYSAEARQYSLLAVLVLGMWVAMLESRKKLFVLCGGLLLWTHNLGAVYLLVAAFIIVGFWWKELFIPGVVAVLINVLWLPFLLQQASDVSNGFWLANITPPGVLWFLTQTTVAYLQKDIAPFLYIAAITLSVVSFYRMAKDYQIIHSFKVEYALIALVIAVPLVLAVISWLWRPVFLARAMLPVGMGLAIIWARRTALFVWFQPLLILFLVACVIGFWGYPRTMDYPTTLQRCEQADSVLYVDVPAAFLGSYQLPGLPSYLWAGANDLNQSLTNEAKAAFGFVQADIKSLNGFICVVASDNPLISTAERSYLHYLLSTYVNMEYRAVYSPIYAFGVYIVEREPHE